MSAVQDVANRAYRDELVAAKSAGRVATVSELHERVAGALIASIGLGVVDLEDVQQEWAESIARRTDRMQTAAGRDVIRDFVRGQLGWMDLLEVVCPVAEGGRVLFGDMTAGDLAAANELRYANVRNAQNSFDDWTAGIFLRALPVLIARQTNLRSAVAKGWLS